MKKIYSDLTSLKMRLEILKFFSKKKWYILYLSVKRHYLLWLELIRFYYEKYSIIKITLFQKIISTKESETNGNEFLPHKINRKTHKKVDEKMLWLLHKGIGKTVFFSKTVRPKYINVFSWIIVCFNMIKIVNNKSL